VASSRTLTDYVYAPLAAAGIPARRVYLPYDSSNETGPTLTNRSVFVFTARCEPNLYVQFRWTLVFEVFNAILSAVLRRRERLTRDTRLDVEHREGNRSTGTAVV